MRAVSFGDDCAPHQRKPSALEMWHATPTEVITVILGVYISRTGEDFRYPLIR